MKLTVRAIEICQRHIRAAQQLQHKRIRNDALRQLWSLHNKLYGRLDRLLRAETDPQAVTEGIWAGSRLVAEQLTSTDERWAVGYYQFNAHRLWSGMGSTPLGIHSVLMKKTLPELSHFVVYRDGLHLFHCLLWDDFIKLLDLIDSSRPYLNNHTYIYYTDGGTWDTLNGVGASHPDLLEQVPDSATYIVHWSGRALVGAWVRKGGENLAHQQR